MVSGSIRGCPSVFAEFSRLEPDLLYSLACLVQCLFVFAKTLNHWLLLCCSTASSLPPPENSSGGPWQLFSDFQTISRLSMVCHSKLRCSQWLRPLLLSNSSIWSIRCRPNSSCQPLLTAPWLTWNSWRKQLSLELRNLSHVNVSKPQGVVAASWCLCMEWRNRGMDVDRWRRWQENLQFPKRGFAVCSPGTLQRCHSQWGFADRCCWPGIWRSLEATASALTLSEISSNEALHAELDAATAGLS